MVRQCTSNLWSLSYIVFKHVYIVYTSGKSEYMNLFLHVSTMNFGIATLLDCVRQQEVYGMCSVWAGVWTPSECLSLAYVSAGDACQGDNI